MPPLPPGFLGTRADLFMDVLIVIVAVVPALLAGSWALARRGALRAHKRAQLALAGVFTVVLTLFEVYIRLKGGVDGISVGSSLHQSWILYGWLWVHLALAVVSAVLWIWLLFASLRRFPNPPAPAAFSGAHRRWGKVAFVTMGLTAITGLGVYALCFVA